MANICVIDDQELIRESLSEALTREDHRVTAMADPVEALEHLRRGPVDAVISDLKMPRMDGIGLLEALRAAGVDVPVIVMTAYATVPTAVKAMKLGAFDYIQKPFDADEICVLVERAVQHRMLRAENEVLRESLREIVTDKRLVGCGQAYEGVMGQIARMADSSATVLIHGESGVGKELVARAIHAQSPRAGRPMLCLNCPALSSQLLESELFGHERGAFTGADRMRKGRFELADGGTLLLDEISEMPLTLQAKLLRVLQEGQFERVGSSVTRAVDVRVIASTNRDLGDWVRAGRFREDLYFRLSVLPLHIRPLRERTEEIPALVEHFLAQIARREGREAKQFTRASLEMLKRYAWPGNVRELENVCQRASVLVTGRMITEEVLRPWLSSEITSQRPGTRWREGHLVEDMERSLIEETLARFSGHREKTARALGIGVRTLGMKLKAWREQGALADLPPEVLSRRRDSAFSMAGAEG